MTTGEHILQSITRVIRKMQQYQEQTCGNFADLNCDMDDIKKRLDHIEELLNEQRKDK